MRPLVRRAAAGSLWLSVLAFPALAQVDRIGGPVEFRSADRQVGAPTLRFAESGSPDMGISLPASPPAPDEVLKQIDKELGRASTRSITGADQATLGTHETADDIRARGKTTFK